MFVRFIDENGTFLEDGFVDVLTEFTIKTPCPDGFCNPKWDGTKWIEGLTQLEISAMRENIINEQTIEQKIEYLAALIMATQGKLEVSQEALDFLIMGGI